jgi:hypothetical protein
MSAWDARLRGLGMVHNVGAGLQIDINAAVRRQGDLFFDGSLCDHNCTTEWGNYTCPAAVSLSRGYSRKSFAPAERILRGIETVLAGLRATNDHFLATTFSAYCDAFRVPAEAALVFAETLRAAPLEINLFGGNPEMHPEITQIVAALRERPATVVNLTTTGRRAMRDAAFAAQLVDAPPTILALSADDFDDAAQVRCLAAMSRDELYATWKAIPAAQGQRQKAVEAIYTAQLLAGRAKPQLLFNLVIHPGNLEQIETLIATLGACFPGCLVNPFPAQSAFLHEPPVIEDMRSFEQIVDRVIGLHHKPTLPVTKRLHYWLALKAACIAAREQPSVAAGTIAGYGLWRCYQTFGANRYIQVGKSSGAHTKTTGGGHMGCFWNEQTITRSDIQVWDAPPSAVSAYLQQEVQQLAARSPNPCPGCGFPRLMFDAISTELGLNPNLVPTYLALRHEHVGY